MNYDTAAKYDKKIFPMLQSLARTFIRNENKITKKFRTVNHAKKQISSGSVQNTGQIYCILYYRCTVYSIATHTTLKAIDSVHNAKITTALQDFHT